MCVHDDSHLANTCDREVAFLMIPIFDYEVNDFSYVACLIRFHPHYSWEGSGETLAV